ncbi:MAG: SCP2 domain-containing protein, partial [Gammaproteobacteria bacterium]
MRAASTTVLTGAQALFNRLLRFDPDTQQRLGALAGRVICLELRDASLRLYVLPTAAGIELRGEYDGTVDVTIAGSAAVFARLMSARGQAPVAGELQISGDIELGQKFQRIVRGLDIDAEEMAAQWVGDVPARQLGNVFRA